ncbi:proline/glycine betaine ABC transporter permease [Citricoccus nitrophenolicus]
MPDLPVGSAVDSLVDWLRENLSPVFDAIHGLISFLIDNVQWALNAPSWWILAIIATALAFWARGWKFATFTVLGLAVIDAMQLWSETMDTVAMAVVATALATLIGVPAGILAARNTMVSNILRPVLDFMQTLPVFVYLIPAIFFFGIGIVPAVVATIIFAVAPAVRLAELGIRQVDPEMVEASTAFGATPGQLLRHVQLPLALPSIMTGINQAIMMSLSMVVIAGMVGAGGLGAVVLRGISQLDIGTGFEGGIAVVFVAIFLDRFTGAFPRAPKQRSGAEPSADHITNETPVIAQQQSATSKVEPLTPARSAV